MLLFLLYPEEYAEKRANPRFVDKKAIIFQVVAEIGAQKGKIISISDKIKWQDRPRPRVYWFETTSRLCDRDWD